MIFKFENKLNRLVSENKLNEAIVIAESELLKFPETDFHKIIGKNLFLLIEGLNNYLETFYNKNAYNIKSVYCEMNGFTINNDLWFIYLFGFEKVEDLEDLGWLADYTFLSDEAMIITGFEDLQGAYADYIKNEKWDIGSYEMTADICELLVILRLQELFRETKKVAQQQGLSWVNVPLFVTAHDSEMIYQL